MIWRLGYPEWACEHDAQGALVRNYYGSPIISPDQFTGEHEAIVPAAGGLPPLCTCGWTRHGGFELADHLRDMMSEAHICRPEGAEIGKRGWRVICQVCGPIGSPPGRIYLRVGPARTVGTRHYWQNRATLPTSNDT